MFKRTCVVLLLLSAAACGGSSNAPSSANVAKNWQGTWQATQTSGSYLIALVMNLTQAGSTVTGTWATSQGNGTVSGTTTQNTFSGTFTWNSLSTTGGACTGTFAVSGAAGGTTLNWTSPAVTGNCTNLPTSITIAVQ
jgi:hypothetical protein